jgi:hypothetical protein
VPPTSTRCCRAGTSPSRARTTPTTSSGRSVAARAPTSTCWTRCASASPSCRRRPPCAISPGSAGRGS